MSRGSSLTAGIRIGRYVLERSIGAGGMGDVWQARDGDLDRRVAIKILARDLAEETARLRFAREARILARLQHPNVVSVHDVGAVDIPGAGEVPYLVMECIDGRPLSQLVTDSDLRPAQALRVMHQVALALGAAHAVGVVHRDLKPSNIMVTADQMVKVLDFGLARVFESQDRRPEETLTAPGSVVGSCAYMAPEQALGDAVTPASDIFGFGAVLYELLSGRRAFPGSNTMGVLRAVARSEVQPLDEVAPGLPPGAVALVNRCLERRPEARFADGAELAAAVEHLENEERTISVMQPAGRPNREWRAPWSARWAIVAAGALVMGGLVGFLGAHRGESPGPLPGRWSVTELLNSTGQLTWASWMPDGGALLVALHDGIRSEILRVPATGRAPTVVLRALEGETLSRPMPSPDGRLFAVLAVAADAGMRVEVWDEGASGPSTVIRDAINPRWLDQHHLQFTRTSEGNTGLWIRGLTDGGETVLEREGEDGAVWDGIPMSGTGGGKALVVGASDIRAGLVVTRGAAETTGRWWLDEGRTFFGGSWAPSGESLVAVIDSQLFRVSAEGPEPLLPKMDNLAWPDFGPKGERIALLQQRTRWDLVAVNPSSGSRECLLCGEAGTSWGSTGPTGELVYRRALRGVEQLVVRTADGARIVLTEPGERPSCPSVSPDGSRVAYLDVAGDGGLELKVRTMDGGPPRILARDLEPSEFPSWSPDGREIAVAGGTPLRVRIAHIDGSPPRVLAAEGADYPVWNPVLPMLAYSIWTDDDDPDQGLWVVESRDRAPFKVSSWPTRAEWSPDGRYLWQLRPAHGGVELWSAAIGAWEWRLVHQIGFGRDATPHDAFRPFSVDVVTGDLVFGLRRTESSLLVISGVDPDRW